MRGAIIATILTFSFAASQFAQSSDFHKSIKEGNDARQSGDHKTADTKFREAMEKPDRERPDDSTYRARFYLGLNAQQAGEKALRAGDKHEAVRLFEEAEKEYKKALALAPASSAVLLNLGTVELQGNDVHDAIGWLERGLALNDQRQPRFATLLGDAERLLAAQEDDDDEKRRHSTKATIYYWQAATTAKTPPSDAHEKLIEELFRTRNGEKLVEYSQLQLRRGFTDLALDATLNGLEAVKLEPTHAASLLDILVAGLAKKGYDRSAFVASETFRQMQLLVKWDIVAPRINGLIALYHGASTAGSLEAWISGPQEQTLAARKSLQQIARALGAASRRDEQIDLAERYYRLALGLTLDSIDPDTFFDLAILLYTHRRSALNELLMEHEPALLAAIATSDASRQFQLHRILGSIYHLVLRLPEAKEHLEAAVRMAAEHESLPLDPALRIQLADVYAALQQPQNSVAQRLSAAEAWAAVNDLTGVRDALSKIDPAWITSKTDGERFRALIEKAVVFLSPVESIDSVSVKRHLAFLAANPDPAMQKPAISSLRFLGVANVNLQSANGTMLLTADKRVVKFYLP